MKTILLVGSFCTYLARVSLADVVYKTRDLGKKQAPKSGSLAGAGARMVCHGRGLGDDVPLATNDEAVERYGTWQFPENGVFIIKPNVFVDRVNLGWGDSCRITSNGAVSSPGASVNVPEAAV